MTTGELLSPAESRRKLITLQLPDVYDPNATHESVDKLLGRLGSREREWVVASMGHSLRGNANERIYLLHGKGGAGKTTLVNAVVDSLGEYGGLMASNALKTSTFSDANKAEPHKHDVAGGVRIVMCDEPETGQYGQMNWASIKEMSGGKGGRARLLNRNLVNLRYTGTMFWLVNELSRVPTDREGDASAVFRRLRLLTVVEIPEKEREIRFKSLWSTDATARQTMGRRARTCQHCESDASSRYHACIAGT